MSTSGNFPDMSTSGGTVFLVAKQSSTASPVTALDANGVFVGAGSQLNMQIRRYAAASVKGGIDTNTEALSGLSDLPEDTFAIIQLLNDGLGNTIQVNTLTPVTDLEDGTGYVATPFTMFKTLGGAQGNKQIAECIIWTRELNPTELTDVYNYLATKYAI